MNIDRELNGFLAFEIEFFADVVKLVDTPDLGSGAERCAGSSPSIRTENGLVDKRDLFCLSYN